LNNSRSLASLFLICFSVLILAGLIWANNRFAHFNIKGEGFSIQWISIQTLEKNGSDPYSNQVTAQIQAAVPRENAFVPDTFPKYTSPLYSGIVVFPFTLIKDKTFAHGLWMTAQMLAVFTILLLMLKLTGWKPASYIFAGFAIFSLFSYHILVPWLDGGLSIWAAFFMILALVSLNSNRYEVGGVFLALSTIQPQMVILPVIYILIWTISKKRPVLILWFFITLILLSVIALFVAPHWIIEYVRLIYQFPQNFPPGSPGIFFNQTLPGLGKQLSWLVSGLTILLLVFEWIISIKKDFRWMIWTVSLTLVLSQWTGIPSTPGNFIALIIPAILVPAMLTERWPRGGQWAAVLLAIVIFSWEWVLFYLDLTSSQPAVQINLIFPLPAILLVGLYWVRWWAIRPRRMLIEELRISETH
jgi:hypothetical protein